MRPAAPLHGRSSRQLATGRCGPATCRSTSSGLGPGPTWRAPTWVRVGSRPRPAWVEKKMAAVDARQVQGGGTPTCGWGQSTRGGHERARQNSAGHYLPMHLVAKPKGDLCSGNGLVFDAGPLACTRPGCSTTRPTSAAASALPRRPGQTVHRPQRHGPQSRRGDRGHPSRVVGCPSLVEVCARKERRETDASAAPASPRSPGSWRVCPRTSCSRCPSQRFSRNLPTAKTCARAPCASKKTRPTSASSTRAGHAARGGGPGGPGSDRPIQDPELRAMKANLDRLGLGGCIGRVGRESWGRSRPGRAARPGAVGQLWANG